MSDLMNSNDFDLNWPTRSQKYILMSVEKYKIIDFLIQGQFQTEKPKWFNLGYILAFVY